MTDCNYKHRCKFYTNEDLCHQLAHQCRIYNEFERIERDTKGLDFKGIEYEEYKAELKGITETKAKYQEAVQKLKESIDVQIKYSDEPYLNCVLINIDKIFEGLIDSPNKSEGCSRLPERDKQVQTGSDTIQNKKEAEK